MRNPLVKTPLLQMAPMKKGIPLLFLGLCVFGIAAPAEAARLYVDKDVFRKYENPANDGQSWQTAHRSLTMALERAQAGDEIWVAQGLYQPQMKDVDRHNRFHVPKNVAVFGGFSGQETDLSQRDWRLHQTILDGNVGLDSHERDNSRHVVVLEDRARLDGFTIQGGRALLTAAERRHRAAKNHKGRQNFGRFDDEAPLAEPHKKGASSFAAYDYHGAGVLLLPGAPQLINSILQNNIAEWGGGLYSVSGSPVLSNVTWRHNQARQGGGALYLHGKTSAMVKNSRFIRNKSGQAGGAILIEGAQAKPRFHNVLLVRNQAQTRGGAVAALHGAQAQFQQATFWDNEAEHDAGGLWNGPYGPGQAATETHLSQSIFWQNHARYGQADMSDWNNAKAHLKAVLLPMGYPGERVRTKDPLFLSPEGGDFRVDAHSPAKGWGYQTSVKEDIQ